MFTNLKGFRTYIAGAALVVLAGLKATNKIDQPTYEAALAFLGGIGLLALRAAV